MRAAPHPLFFATRLFVCAVAALWALDVLVNLGLLPGLWFPEPLTAHARDFVGLLVLSSQVALAVTGVALVSGILAGRVGERAWAAQSVAALAGVLSGVQVLAQASIVWSVGGTGLARSLAWGGAVGGAWWIALYFASGIARVEHWTLPRMAGYTLFAPLVTGYANLALADAVRGLGAPALMHAALALGWLAIACAARFRVALWSPAWLALALAIWAGATPDRGRRAEPQAGVAVEGTPPPIFLVVLDTVRADHLALYGYARDTMPALEQWARSAFVALRAVSPAGWTSPAHASIFSGLPVSLHGIHYGMRSFVTEPFPGIRWLPEDLAASGYRTLAVSANPLALPKGVTGFDEVVAPRRNAWHASSIAALVDQRSPLLRRVSERLRWRMPHAEAGEIVDLVLRRLPAAAEPLFAFVNIMDAHSPYNPPAEALQSLGLSPGRSFGRYRSHRELTRMWSELPASKSADLVALYDAELRGIDTELARLLDGIEARYGGRAVVIVASDHGEELGEEGRVGHEQGLAQRLLHVPLLIRGPGFPAGRFDEVADLRRLHDLILSLARGDAPDLAALFEPDEFGVIAERYPSGELGGAKRPALSLIAQGVKVVGPSSAGFQSFDLAQGFDAEVPLRDAEAARGLRERVEAYWESHRDRREESAEQEDEDRSRLRSLGYVN